jgi:hypothetical protein
MFCLVQALAEIAPNVGTLNPAERTNNISSLLHTRCAFRASLHVDRRPNNVLQATRKKPRAPEHGRWADNNS